MPVRETSTTIKSFESAWCAERPDLDPYPVSTDMRIQLVARRFSEQSAEALSEFSLGWWEYDVLSALLRQGAPYSSAVSAISDIYPLSSGALTNRLDQLVNKQLVSRTNDKKDRRRVIVRLTRKGINLVNKAATVRFDTAAANLETLSQREKNQLNRLLGKLL